MVDFAIQPAATGAVGPLFAATRPLQSRPAVPLPPMIATFDVDENGKTLAPMLSPIAAPNARMNGLNPRTPRFRTVSEKDAFEWTLPTAVQAQLNQPFGKDNLTQCFCLQKTGNVILFLLYKSGFLSNADKKKLERSWSECANLRASWHNCGSAAPECGFFRTSKIPSGMPIPDRAVQSAKGYDYGMPLPF